MTKRILIWGTSLRKPADEAQFIAVSQSIRSVEPDADIRFLARPPDSLRDYRVLRTRRLGGVLWLLARSRLLLFIGGCFMESRRQALVCAALVVLAKLTRTKTAAAGVSAFPYRTRWGRVIYRWIFNRMIWITVREEAAERAISALDISVRPEKLADPRFLLSASETDRNKLLRRLGIETERPLVAATTRHMHDDLPDWVKRSHGYEPAARDTACHALAAAIDALSEHAQVVIVPLHASTQDDLRAVDQLKPYLKAPDSLVLLSRDISARDTIDLIQACDLVVAARLGVGIFATAVGTPMVALAYESRLQELMVSLELGEFVRPWLQVDPDDFGKLALRAWRERRALARRMQRASQPLIKDARRNAELVGHTLDARKSRPHLSSRNV